MFHLIVLYKWVLYLSFSASILILFTFFIVKLLKQKLRLQIQYIIGLFILIRLIIPMLPQSSFSIFNITPIFFNRPPVISVVDKFDYDQHFTENSDEKALRSIQGNKEYWYLNPSIIENGSSISTIKFTFIIWILGVILGVFYMIMSYKICLNEISRCNQLADDRIIGILEKCKKDMKIKTKIAVVKGENVRSPAIFGFFNPKILIPQNIIEYMNDNDIRNIFLHELSHHKRKDILTNYIIRIVNVVYWFNPLIWCFIKKMKRDMELCCDSLALCYVENDKLKEYGYTMLNLIKYCKFNTKRKLNMAVGVSVNAEDVVRRINVIKQFKKSSPKIFIISIFILLVFGTTMLTEAKINNVFPSNAFLSNINNNISSKYIVDELGRNRIIDNIDYPYQYDSKIIGSWKCVDSVGYISDFKKYNDHNKKKTYIKELKFFENGTTDKKWLTWTKGIIINKADKLSNEYLIKDIAGETYMFFQCKSGDYAFGCRRPSYYVLKKVKS